MTERVEDADPQGRYWVFVHHEDFPAHEIGFRFTAAGINDAYCFQPQWLETGQQITTRLLRAVPVAQLERRARELARRAASTRMHDAGDVVRVVDASGKDVAILPIVKGGGPGSTKQRDAVEHLRALDGEGQARKRSGGRPAVLTERFYAEQARRYVDALGASTSPVEAVARTSGYSNSQVRNHIAQARAMGLLTGTARGRAGGELTARAQRILSKKDAK